MTDPLQRHTILFVVRVWAEYLVQEPPSWRGEIVLLPDGAAETFAALPDITTFISTHCPSPCAPPGKARPRE